ncbi:dynein regulation protein LC7 [Kitasatospora sp. NE20-6]|uniref:roadblock/LC7 domain-containing protein n=1 Tax=Kitasatospora sp. NE20-6 TaxID=2859066 RepID=UPI0034DC94BF
MIRGTAIVPDLAPYVAQLGAMPGVQAVVVAAVDGMRLAASASLSREAGERTCAMVSSLLSASRAAGGAITDSASVPAVGQVVVESDLGFLIVMPAGENSTLAALAEPGADIGTVAFEMSRSVAALGRVFGTAARAEG